MVKAQVPVIGRGKTGGIIPANSLPEAQSALTRLTGAEMKSFPVKQVLIEEILATKKELRLDFTIARFNGYYVMLTSKKKDKCFNYYGLLVSQETVGDN